MSLRFYVMELRFAGGFGYGTNAITRIRSTDCSWLRPFMRICRLSLMMRFSNAISRIR